MLIDNRDSAGRPGETKTVADFIRKYTNPALGRVGALDIVTGYFTIAGLDLLYRELSPQNTYRLVLSELADDDAFLSRAIDLLRGDAGIEASLKLSAAAKNAVAFLERATVEVRALTNAFCHAKAYVYTDATDDAHDYFVVGSSNLTEAGLGLHASSNVELNLAQTGRTSAEYASLRRWFRQQWETVAKGAMPVGPRDGSPPEVDVKEYFIARIEECFGRVHTPEEIYYRVLLELFGGELDFAADAVSEREMALLQDSAIYRTLFGYQRKGVVSLIKMLKKWNGAILADAVGLGKTFSALAVIKHFQNNGYQTLLLCPKKLEQNWMQYLRKQGSRFDGDAFDYVVKFHTDLQDDRMEGGPVKLSWLLKQRKLLVVVDESHNLRNDKSARYQMLLDRILGKAASDKARDVKVLLLSATPINNGLLDIRNQFRLIARGDNAAFDNEDFQVADLDRLFQGANRRFNEWCQKDGRTIGDFFDTLPSNFFNLTDKLIVARTRRMVENTLGEDLGFPKKLKPANEYVGLDGLGDYPDVTAVYEALLKTNLTAYQPTQYMEAAVAPDERGKDWQDNAYREKSLVKMMAVLFMKRLESCWLSCMTTVEKVLGVPEVEGRLRDVARGRRDVRPGLEGGAGRGDRRPHRDGLPERGPEPPGQRPGDQLRHPLEPRATHPAFRAHRPHRLGERGRARGQLLADEDLQRVSPPDEPHQQPHGADAAGGHGDPADDGGAGADRPERPDGRPQHAEAPGPDRARRHRRNRGERPRGRGRRERGATGPLAGGVPAGSRGLLREERRALPQDARRRVLRIQAGAGRLPGRARIARGGAGLSEASGGRREEALPETLPGASAGGPGARRMAGAFDGRHSRPPAQEQGRGDGSAGRNPEGRRRPDRVALRDAQGLDCGQEARRGEEVGPGRPVGDGAAEAGRSEGRGRLQTGELRPDRVGIREPIGAGRRTRRGFQWRGPR